MVQLLEEDLCSAVCIGDMVDVVGQAELVMPAKAASGRCLAEVQVQIPPFLLFTSQDCVAVEYAF